MKGNYWILQSFLLGLRLFRAWNHHIEDTHTKFVIRLFIYNYNKKLILCVNFFFLRVCCPSFDDHDLVERPNFAFPKNANSTNYFRTVLSLTRSSSTSLTRRRLTVPSRTKSFCSVAGHNILIRHAENAVCFSSLTEVEDRRPPSSAIKYRLPALRTIIVYVLWLNDFFCVCFTGNSWQCHL